MNPLISIIVPIFNVENYLEQCIQSIVNQTYRNLEIILLDDGSSDRCPQICDKWATKDNRIKVIHKKNGGVSSARNYGLKISKGKYIGFVDSDDYVNPTMYEELLNCLIKTNTKISICGYYELNAHETIPKCIPNNVISSDKFLEYIFNDTFVSVLWNKLFSRELFFDNNKLILFNEDIYLGEDALMLVSVAKTGVTVSTYNKCLYNYRILNNGLSQGIINNNKISLIKALDLINDKCKVKSTNIIRLAKNFSVNRRIYILTELYQSNIFEKNQYIFELKKYIKKNFKYCNNKLKLKVLLILYFPKIYIYLKKR